MKNLFLITITLILSINFSVLAQIDMKQGFNYLETGKYVEAETFFKTILNEFPTNKTAKLCYGRAVGLNGDAEKAVTIFTDLLKKYPNDFEIKLNYAESLLWSSQFNKAKGYYKNLVTEEPKSFSALLGYANTLSNLKEYENALTYVNKALEVSPGNPNALTSKKYIRLGYAYQFQQKQDYNKALTILDQNLSEFKLDKETLLNKANVYLIKNEPKNAEKAYFLLATNKKDSIIALNGLSLVSHLQNKEKDALKTVEKALEKTSSIKDDSLLVNQTKERYIQALIWNQKYKTAEKEINQLLKTSPNENWILSLRATLGMYRSDFKECIADYNQILKNDSISFDGNLGGANAQLANGNENGAYNAVFKTLEVFPNQKDAMGFLKKLNEDFTPFIEEKLAYTFDNGNNNSFSSTTSLIFPFSTKLKATANYQYRTTENTVTKNKANSNNLTFGLTYKIHPKITFNSSLGINKANSFTNNYEQLLVDVNFKLKPLKLQDLEIGYKREIQNFNADLLDKEIVTNNYYANYNISSNFNLGWFTQFFHTTQNDGNARNLLFTSLYYNFLKKPALKGGINYQFISFKDQVPTIYFSPEKFNAIEIFADLLKDEKITKPKNWFYGLNGASGFQFIEDNKRQLTYRIQSKIGYKFSDRLLMNLFGQHTNIASATASGFTFTEIGLRIKWYITKKPIFINKNGTFN
ncbi:tetratricopeptide repeat protein [Tenacibaculum adriaticum]|uniref:Tetratricopeptide repeat protein n=1 Tax=Tenacibaculum adriaticum TaxID=413713 RepID=A0A5S5DLB1_9FLAO|nr:tetratricopeptide repeat protein [Tenacibaculum adriaticum]TYP96713.1 tetratricopeptide repeat protein [Tenacibaculum adriaticum]